MRRLAIWIGISSCSLLLQGCLLDYFFAPKTSAGELPIDPQMESLRSAYISHCGRCHLLIAPRYFDRERPIDRYTERYVSLKILTRKEADDAAAYIRFLSARPLTPSPQPSPSSRPSPTTTPGPTASPSPQASAILEIPLEADPTGSPSSRPDAESTGSPQLPDASPSSAP